MNDPSASMSSSNAKGFKDRDFEEDRGTDRFAFIPDHLWGGGRERKARPKQKWGERGRLILGYLPDWIITIVLGGGFLALDKIDGFRREFSLTDTSIQHTFATKERIPFWLAIVIAGAGPLAIILFVSLVMMRNFWDAHNGSLVTVGRPRPDLIDRCQPAAGSVNAPVYGLVTSAICTRTDLLTDGFRSFPSGHSSGAFCGLGYLTFYLAGKFHLFDRKGHAIKAWIAVIPLFGAAYVAISRTEDYRHHATDVIAGSLLGLVLGYICYRLYYPGLHERTCHLPYSPRHTRRRRDGSMDDHGMGEEEIHTGGMAGSLSPFLPFDSL
ncbi:PAP2-domain-containing protein [Atractiella rhizophila]|nr:PAP2-domain-containing protein [Atractiella rhizophila]